MPTTLQPAADKLPLAVRKDLRDKWESTKKAETEKQISDLLGESWTIKVDANLIYANVTDESYRSRLGEVTNWYFEPFVQNLKRFVDKFGDDGKSELNSTVTSHTIAFGPQDTTDFSYGGLVVEDGVLRLVFKAPEAFASNVGDVTNGVEKALKDANAASGGGKAYNIVAREGVAKNYTPKISDLQKKIGEMVAVADIKLNPNFEANAEALSKGKSAGGDWDRSLGKASFDYFENLASNMRRAGFEKDDMLQEGFQEAVPKNEILLRVVEKLNKGSYNEVILDDGKLVIQVLPVSWWSNVGDTGAKVIDLL